VGEMSVTYSGTGYNDLIPSFEVTGEIPFFYGRLDISQFI
jgi:hypothetical protein